MITRDEIRAIVPSAFWVEDTAGDGKCITVGVIMNRHAEEVRHQIAAVGHVLLSKGYYPYPVGMGCLMLLHVYTTYAAMKAGEPD